MKNLTKAQLDKLVDSNSILTSISKEELEEKMESGIIKQDWLYLKNGYTGLYDVGSITQKEITSFITGKEIEVDLLHFSNTNNRFALMELGLWKMFVIESEVKTAPIAGDIENVYYREDFMVEFPNCKKLGDIRNEDGSSQYWDKYYIAGAVVTRSKVDPSRHAVPFKLYKGGMDFLALERQITGKQKLSWISEERLHELAALPLGERQLLNTEGKVLRVVPGTAELKILYNADKDVKFASATFILRKIWK